MPPSDPIELLKRLHTHPAVVRTARILMEESVAAHQPTLFGSDPTDSSASRLQHEATADGSGLKRWIQQVVGALMEILPITDDHSTGAGLPGYDLRTLDAVVGWAGFGVAALDGRLIERSADGLGVPLLAEVAEARHAARRGRQDARERMRRSRHRARDGPDDGGAPVARNSSQMLRATVRAPGAQCTARTTPSAQTQSTSEHAPELRSADGSPRDLGADDAGERQARLLRAVQLLRQEPISGRMLGPLTDALRAIASTRDPLALLTEIRDRADRHPRLRNRAGYIANAIRRELHGAPHA